MTCSRKARREIGTRRWLAYYWCLQLKLHPINPRMIPLISTFPPSSFSTEAVPSWPWRRVHGKRSDEVRAGNQNKTSSRENTLPWGVEKTWRNKVAPLATILHIQEDIESVYSSLTDSLFKPFTSMRALSSWFIDWCMLENVLWSVFIMIISELYQCSFVLFVIVS